MNYKINRALLKGHVEDIQPVAKNIHNFVDWKREMLAIASAAETDSRILNTFAYYGAAEFFMFATDPDPKKTSKSFWTYFTKPISTLRLGAFQ